MNLGAAVVVELGVSAPGVAGRDVAPLAVAGLNVEAVALALGAPQALVWQQAWGERAWEHYSAAEGVAGLSSPAPSRGTRKPRAWTG